MFVCLFIFPFDAFYFIVQTSSETRGKIVGARESQNGRRTIVARFDFPSSQRSAPGSARMGLCVILVVVLSFSARANDLCTVMRIIRIVL